MSDGREERRSVDRRPDRPPLLPVPPSEPIPPVDARGFGASLALALSTARARRRPVSLVLVDVDEDAALEAVTAVLRTTIRESDGVWRPGPLRLAVLLADAGGPESEPAIERLMVALSDTGAGISLGRAAAAPGIDAQALFAIAEGDIRQLGSDS